jgi:hypothetical protein
LVEVNVAKLLGLEIIIAIIGVKREILRFLERMSAVRCLAFSRSLLSIILLLLMSAPGESASVNDALNKVVKDTLLRN